MALVGALPSKSFAMEFEITEMNGREVLLASGPIENGDALRYRQALDQTPVQPHGARVVLLDSPGGSVGAAFAMSDVNNDYTVHMYIPDGASCASACASILYISGDYRTMATTGRFGQHSCARNGVPQPDCNELIAMHAFEHGVAHGAVAAFVTNVPPEDILWFSDTDLDCWGISYFPFSRQSGFQREDPCFMEIILGEKPDSQSVWRVELKEDGYRAFARPVADDTREFELGLYCDEKHPSQLFLEFDLTGPESAVRDILRTGYLVLGEDRRIETPYAVRQVDQGFTRITMTVRTPLVLDVLTVVDRIGTRFEVPVDYVPITSWTGTGGSREALIFAANHCVNRLEEQG
jgi:hypothetical protein